MQMKAIQETINSLRAEADKSNRAADALEEVLRGVNGTYARAHGHGRTGTRTRARLSPEARRRIVLAQKARWAKFRARKAKHRTQAKRKPVKPASVHKIAQRQRKLAAIQLKKAKVAKSSQD